MTRATTCLLIGVLAGCGSQAADGEPTSSSQRTVTESAGGPLRFSDALARAEEHYPGAAAFEVEYETHQGQRVVEVEVLRDGAVREIYYDPASGEVVHEGDESPEADEAAAIPTLREEIAAGRVSMRGGLELATSHYPEDAVEAVELVVRDGRTLVSVLVREGSGAHRYLHDPTTGDVVSDGAGSLEHDEAGE